MEKIEDESKNQNKEESDKSMGRHAFSEQQRYLDAEADTGCSSLEWPEIWRT